MSAPVNFIIPHRNDRQFHQIAPLQRELRQGLRILGFKQIDPATEIGARPAPE